MLIWRWRSQFKRLFVSMSLLIEVAGVFQTPNTKPTLLIAWEVIFCVCVSVYTSMAFQHSKLWVAVRIYKWLYFLVCRRHDAEASSRRLSPLLSLQTCVLCRVSWQPIRYIRIHTSPQEASTCVNTACVPNFITRIQSSNWLHTCLARGPTCFWLTRIDVW